MPRKTRKTYKLETKLEVSKFAEKNGTADAVKKFKIHRNQILRWKKDINLMESKKNKEAKVVSRTRRIKWPKFVNKFHKIILTRKNEGFMWTKKTLLQQALTLAAGMNIKDFKCSVHWLRCFIKRRKLDLSTFSKEKHEDDNGDNSVIIF